LKSRYSAARIVVSIIEQAINAATTGSLEILAKLPKRGIPVQCHHRNPIWVRMLALPWAVSYPEIAIFDDFRRTLPVNRQKRV